MNLVDSVLQGCAEDEFQQAVFEDPDMPLDEMNLLHAQIYQDYMGYPLVYEWVDIHHHFETPFYYVSYATSARVRAGTLGGRAGKPGQSHADL
mgnify:CR=1 FL=1